MNTPITESHASLVYRWDSKRANYQPAGIMIDANVARKLESDRAALMEALEDMIDDKASLPGKPRWAAYKKARAALAAARANFPDPS